MKIPQMLQIFMELMVETELLNFPPFWSGYHSKVLMLYSCVSAYLCVSKCCHHNDGTFFEYFSES